MGRPIEKKFTRPPKNDPYWHYYFDLDNDDDIVHTDPSLEALSKFPPTMLINSTRDSTLSTAVQMHRQLTRAGIDADLQVWDGLPHCFHNVFPAIPESREAYLQMVTFFDKHLGNKGFSNP